MFQSTYNAALSGNPQSATSQQYPNGNPDGTLNPPGGEKYGLLRCAPTHRGSHP